MYVKLHMYVHINFVYIIAEIAIEGGAIIFLGYGTNNKATCSFRNSRHQHMSK